MVKKFGKKIPSSLVVVIFIGIFFFHIWSLMRFPPFMVDEAWLASRAWSFIHDGVIFGTLDAGVFDRFEGYWTFFPVLPTLIQSFGLRLVNIPSPLPLRITSFVSGITLIVAIFVIGYKLGGYKLATIYAILVSVSLPFFISAHWGRQDILAATFGYSTVALYLNNNSRYWLSFLSGLLLGLAFEIHPHSAIFIPAVFMLALVQSGKKIFTSKTFLSFIAGGLLSAFFYMMLHVLPYPSSYFSFQSLVYSITHTPPIFTLNLKTILRSFYELGINIFDLNLIIIPLFIYAIIVLSMYGSESEKIILIFTITLLFSAGLLIRNKLIYYSILYNPAITMVVASYLFYIDKIPNFTFTRIRINRVMAWSFTISMIIITFIQIIPNRNSDYKIVQNRLNELINPEDTIMASQIYWFGLFQNPYFSWEQLVYYKRYEPDSNLEDAFREFKPDIFIVDNQLQQFVRDDSGSFLYFQYLTIPQSDLINFLNNNAKLIDEFNSDLHGHVDVYWINWHEISHSK